MPALPSYLQIEPVGQCNLRCTMCAIQFRPDGPPFGPLAFMDFDRFTQLLAQFPSGGTLHLQGLGEPLMHPRFFDMVRHAVSRGFRVTTNSNMTLLNQRRARLCVESGLDCLHCSVDGATAETYERIRLRGRFSRVVANIERLVEVRDELKSQHPRMHLVMVIMRQNLHELADLVRLASRWSMDEVFVQHLAHDFAESQLPERYSTMRKYVDDQSLLLEDPTRVRWYFDQARMVAEELGITLRLPRHDHATAALPSVEVGQRRCEWPWRAAYIAYDGRSMPCCMVSTPDRINFGSMVERGVSAVWEGPEYQAFRQALDSDRPPDICRSCGIYNGTF